MKLWIPWGLYNLWKRRLSVQNEAGWRGLSPKNAAPHGWLHLRRVGTSCPPFWDNVRVSLQCQSPAAFPLCMRKEEIWRKVVSLEDNQCPDHMINRICDLPCTFGCLIRTPSVYLMVVLVVSVPARKRFSTVETKFSYWNSLVGRFFSWEDTVDTSIRHD